VNTIGSTNTAVGNDALQANTTANGNTGMGYDALRDNTTGSNNTAIGESAMATNTTGFGNIAIGHNSQSGNFSNSIIIGRSATATANNQFVVGSAAVNAGAVINAPAPQTHYWNVKINGVDYKILMAL
jgi:hypothetical protein